MCSSTAAAGAARAVPHVAAASLLGPARRLRAAQAAPYAHASAASVGAWPPKTALPPPSAAAAARPSRRGQLKSFKESVGYLKKGVGIFAFPEGTRSRNGRLMPFKGGVFSMAMKAGVPIVPISVVGTFETYPPAAALPILPNGENLRVHIHPQVHLEDRTEAELEQLTRDAILSALPPENQPLPTAEPALEREVPAAAKVGTPA